MLAGGGAWFADDPDAGFLEWRSQLQGRGQPGASKDGYHEAVPVAGSRTAAWPVREPPIRRT